MLCRASRTSHIALHNWKTGSILRPPFSCQFSISLCLHSRPWREYPPRASRPSTSKNTRQRQSAARLSPQYVSQGERELEEKDVPEVGPSKRLLLPHVLSARLKNLCDKGSLDDAVSMLKNSPRDAQNTPVWNTLIWECMKARRFKQSYDLFIDMKRRGFSPSTRTFQTMFTGLSHIERWQIHTKQLANAHSLYDYFQRHVEAAKKYDSNSPELSITPLAYYIKILGDAGCYQRIFDVYYEMDREGPLSPNQFIFTAIFQALSQRNAPTSEDDRTIHAQNASDAKALWRQLLKSSTRPPGFTIDAHVISAAILALSRGRNTDQTFALEIVAEYLGLTRPDHPPIRGKLPLNVQTLAAALMLCNRMQDNRLCIHFLDQVKDRPEDQGGVSIIDRGHMEEVFRAYVALTGSRSRDISKQALEMLEWMLKQDIIRSNESNIRPTLSTYNLVLMTCWRGADWDSATRTFELMTGYDVRDFEDRWRPARSPRPERRSKGRNLVPDAAAMSSMVRAASASRNSASMRQVLRMVHHLGLDNLLGNPSAPGKVAALKEAKNTTFHQVKLAAALFEIMDVVLPPGKAKAASDYSKEETIWFETRARVREIVRKAAEGRRASATETDVDGQPSPNLST